MTRSAAVEAASLFSIAANIFDWYYFIRKQSRLSVTPVNTPYAVDINVFQRIFSNGTRPVTGRHIPLHGVRKMVLADESKQRYAIPRWHVASMSFEAVIHEAQLNQSAALNRSRIHELCDCTCHTGSLNHLSTTSRRHEKT